jgi:alpha-galactosidase
LSVHLENLQLQLQLDSHRNTFNVRARHAHGPQLLQARLGLRYRLGHQAQRRDHWKAVQVSNEGALESVHGTLRTRRLRFGPDRQGVGLEVCFGVSSAHPILLWSASVYNQGRRPIRIQRIEMLNLGFYSFGRSGLMPAAGEAARGHFHFGNDFPDAAFFSNGWGSWGHSGAYGSGDRPRRTRLGPFTAPMRVNPGTPQPRSARHYASDMFAVLGDRRSREAFLVGFLSQQAHFGSVEALTEPLAPALSVWANGDSTLLEPGEAMETDWVCLHFLHLDSPDPLGIYLAAVARQHGLAPAGDAGRAGWCSWYQYFQEISPQVIRTNLEAAAKVRDRLPLELVQIDDGWQAQVGDWDRFSPTFSDGLAPLAAEIQAAGFEAGLWLAPFIVNQKSALFRSRPEWILRNRFGLPVNAGYNWDRFNAALDMSNPQALEHACEAVHRAAHNWGFSFLKLDFLYAGALRGVRADPKKTRAQVLRSALEGLREAAGRETHLLGCGVPLGSALGLFESVRIGADVAPYWLPRVLGSSALFSAEPDLPAGRNALQNALTRAPMHRRWWINDPDCVLLRPDSDLSEAEMRTIATVAALTGGLLMISDDLAALPEESIRLAQSLLPPIDRRPMVLDWFDSATPTQLRLDLDGPAGRWHLAALINWADRPQDAALLPRDFFLDPAWTYLGRDFWTGQVCRIEPGGRVFKAIPPHGCLLLALRPLDKSPLYLGSDLHISQGLEVTAWTRRPDRLHVRLERPGRVEGVVDLWLPEGYSGGAGIERQGEGHFRLPVRFEESFEFEVI